MRPKPSQWIGTRPPGHLFAALAFLAVVVACTGETGHEAPRTQRLVDLFTPEMVEGGTVAEREVEPVARWRFDGDPPSEGEHAATFGWRPVTGVSGLRVEEGHLVGTITEDLAALHVERQGGEQEKDHLHAVEVSLRLTGGETLGLELLGQDRFDEERFLGRPADAQLGWWRAEVSPGREVTTHVLTSQTAQRASSARQVVLSIQGAAGESFAIEEVRIVSEKEHLAGVGSGPGWQGLADVHRDTLVTRAPERVRIPVTVPEEGPWLDLRVGTPETRPVRFLVRVEGPDGEGARLLERLVTTPHRWEPASLDLARHAGQEVVLELALEAEDPGILGYWGSPAVRSRAPAARGSDGAAAPRGVILLLADTLRPDHLEPYGYARQTAPTLARLATEGTRFTDVVSQGTWTKVAVPSMVTSLPVSSHGVTEFDDRLSDTAVTLAELYRDAGYATAAFSSVLFTGAFSNMQQGYEVLHERGSVETDGYPSKTARDYVDRAAEWLEEQSGGPFFLFLHVFDPHDPFEPRPPDDVRWADPEVAEQHREWQERVREVIEDPLLKDFGMPSRSELEEAGIDPDAYVAHDVDWYDGSIRGMDSQVARLLGRLDEMGLSDEVLVAFTSDHGEEFLEHGRTFHGQSVYGELAQVPLILWRPGLVPAGTVVDETVRSIDLMPTLLELSGLARPEFLQGQSLAPLLRAERGGGENDTGRQWRPRPAVVEKARIETFGGPPPMDTESRAIVHEGWKLVHHAQRAEGTPEYELFDHRTDRLDLHDLAADHPEVVSRLAAQLERWREGAQAARLPEAERAEDLSAEERERLRSLGYVQ